MMNKVWLVYGDVKDQDEVDLLLGIFGSEEAAKGAIKLRGAGLENHGVWKWFKHYIIHEEKVLFGNVLTQGSKLNAKVS